MTIDLDALIADWPVDKVSAAVVDTEAALVAGDAGWNTRIASVSKLLAAYAVLVAVEEETVALDEPAGGIDGATLRHLLAHASGLDFDTDRQVAGVEQRRIYSNTGIERAAEHLAARAGMPFDRYLAEAVFEPLGMTSTVLSGSPAHAVFSTATDLSRFARELLDPSLLSASTLAEATSAQYPALSGVLPGIGRFDPNPWGLGFELKGSKDPHWSGTMTSSRTFGHFGGAGTFLWVDPVRDLALIALTDRDFGSWSMEVWPAFSDAVIDGS